MWLLIDAVMTSSSPANPTVKIDSSIESFLCSLPWENDKWNSKNTHWLICVICRVRKILQLPVKFATILPVLALHCRSLVLAYTVERCVFSILVILFVHLFELHCMILLLWLGWESFWRWRFPSEGDTWGIRITVPRSHRSCWKSSSGCTDECWYVNGTT